MLTLAGVEAGYGRSLVLHGVDLTVGDGEVVTLLGRNGMGKTTTIRTICGLLPARSGAIAFGGRPIACLPPHRIGRAGIGLVPEGRQIFPTLSVRENLLATAANRERRPAAWTLSRIGSLFPILAERHGQPASLLSGGEQQMLAIGRALMTNPKLLILDEATEGLAPLARKAIWQCLIGLKQAGQSILIIDKNLGPLMALADRHHIIEKGRICWTGSSAALAAEGDLKGRYLGV